MENSDIKVYQELVKKKSPEFFCDAYGQFTIILVHSHFMCPNCKLPTKCCEGLPADD